MARTLSEKLLAAHVSGELPPVGEALELKIDQTLTQDATGTLVLLQFETLGVPRVRTELSAQYVDHNLLQVDHRNSDDHRFLATACRKYGLWFSRPGNGVSHPVHMERFGVPGKTLLGSDSHTCAAGSLGMLAIGAGGLDVALAMAGLPFRVKRPRTLGVHLVGRLPDWVSAKDVILELLRRRGVAGCVQMIAGRKVPPEVSFDINPTSRQILTNLIHLGYLEKLARAGARIHQAGCNGCIGMGQAPATESISLRTVPRNFPGRSGTHEDRVYLCSPETAAASALTGKITDPRTLDMGYPRFAEPREIVIDTQMLEAPAADGDDVEVVKGPNIASLPDLEPPPDKLTGVVMLKVGDDVSTDEILPAGAEVLPLRSNLPAISRFVYRDIDPDFAQRARASTRAVVIVGGRNYGQGSSREHAALAPRFLGVRMVVAQSFARIHYQNLVNFGVLPLTLADPNDLAMLGMGDEVIVENLYGLLDSDQTEVSLFRPGSEDKTSVVVPARLELDAPARAVVRAGGRLNLARKRLGG